MKNIFKKIVSIFFIVTTSLMFADGALDTTFNGTGTVITPFPAYALAQFTGVYVQADGKIVAVGSNAETGTAQTNFVVARYLTNGTLDATFGSGGIATISLVPLGVSEVLTAGVAVQSDGKVVVVGSIVNANANERIFSARLTATGSLDTTYNAAGTQPGVFVFPGFVNAVSGNDTATATVIDVNGRVVVVGLGNQGQQMAIGRLNANGTLDTTFNGTGMLTVIINGSGNNFANAVALLADGETILAAGSADITIPAVGPASNFAYAQISPTGVVQVSEIATFSTNNTELADITSEVFSVLIQPNGQIVLIGQVDWFDGNNYFALARYNANGTLDTTFIGNTQGTVNPHQNPGTLVAPSDGGVAEASFAFAGGLQSNGSIIVAGYGPETSTTVGNRFMLARFIGSNGDLDTTFNGGGAPAGFVFTSFGTSAEFNDQCLAMALQGNGDIVAAGSTRTQEIPAPIFDFALARYVVSTPLQATTITSPVNGSIFSAGPISFAGNAQNPSIVDFFLDGVQIQADSTVTIGAGNSWSIPNVAVGPGVHTALVVGRYRDDGHVNLEAEVTFEICDVVAGDTGVNDCINGTVSGSLVPLVTGGTGPYTFAVNGAPVGGSVSVSPTGIYIFTANIGFSGPGSFGYQVTDPFGCTGVGEVTVTVASPTATNSTIATCENSSANGNLNNNVTGGTLPYTFARVGVVVNGSVSINATTGAFTFTPTTNLVGTGSFQFQATDANGCVSNVATITIDINATPVAENVMINTCQNISVSGNLNNDVTGGTPPYIFAQVGTAVNGTVSINAITGAFTFTPTHNFVGIGSFRFQATDSNGCVSNVATITVNIPCCPPSNPFLALIEELYWHLPPVV